MNEVATYTDRYGDERTIHRTRHGLKVKRQGQTPILALNPAVAELVGARIRELRLERGWTLEELATRCGITSGHPKSRMWAIENSGRGEGIRFGTLYTLAIALGVEATDLLPTVEQVTGAADVTDEPVPQVRFNGGAA